MPQPAIINIGRSKGREKGRKEEKVINQNSEKNKIKSENSVMNAESSECFA